MKPIKTKILTGLTALATALMPSLASADFYDGVRGPSKAQAHYTLTAPESHNIALKYFGEDLLSSIRFEFLF